VSPALRKGSLKPLFQLADNETHEIYSRRKNRPNQSRFAFDVYKRYGRACAVCGPDVTGLFQAAHLVTAAAARPRDQLEGLQMSWCVLAVECSTSLELGHHFIQVPSRHGCRGHRSLLGFPNRWGKQWVIGVVAF
jgi:hypothetical protein